MVEPNPEGDAMLTVPGSTAVVTGASSGIGRQIALEFAAAGAIVVALARREERLTEVATTMRRSTPDSEYVVCDVSDTDQFVQTLHDIEQRHGRLDILIN